MMAKIVGFKYILVFLFCLIASWSYEQIIHSGEITFTRRTNLEKRFENSTRMSGSNFKKMIKEPREDMFKLYFNDTSSLFVPVLENAGDTDWTEWMTMKNSTFQNLNKQQIEREFSYVGSKLYLRDNQEKRNWIITGGERNIAGYHTKQALWIAKDSTKIYAWFSEQIAPSVGPESYYGLPGTILGLAIEDGGVVYFATEVKPLKETNFLKLMPKGKAKDYYTKQELQEFIDKKFKPEDVGGRVLDDFYLW